MDCNNFRRYTQNCQSALFFADCSNKCDPPKLVSSVCADTRIYIYTHVYKYAYVHLYI